MRLVGRCDRDRVLVIIAQEQSALTHIGCQRVEICVRSNQRYGIVFVV